MTAGRKLYDKYVDSLASTQRHRYIEQRWTRVYPVELPVAWPFLTEDERRTWDDLARKIQPRPRRSA